jgi:hypothetical protein
MNNWPCQFQARKINAAAIFLSPDISAFFISVTCQVLYNKSVINIIYYGFYTKHYNAIASFVVSLVVVAS